MSDNAPESTPPPPEPHRPEQAATPGAAPKSAAKPAALPLPETAGPAELPDEVPEEIREISPPMVFAREDQTLKPEKPVTYDASDLAAQAAEAAKAARVAVPVGIQDLRREAAEAIPTAGESAVVPAPGLSPAAPLPEPIEAIPELAPAGEAPPASSALPSPVAAVQRVVRAAGPSAAAAVVNNRPVGPYRPAGYPIGGAPKIHHVLAALLCTTLLLLLAYFVIAELLTPSRPPVTERGLDNIGPPLAAPGTPPGEPQLLDSLTGPDGTPLYSVPSALNESFETPTGNRDFVRYQEGAEDSTLTARGLTLARNPEPGDRIHGGQCLAVEVHFPLESGAWKNVDFIAAPAHPGCPVGPAAAVLYDVYVPPGMPGIIKAAFHLKDRHGAWFQAESPQRLQPGQWNTVLADLRPRQGLVRPVGHAATFQQLNLDQSAGFGFSFYGDMAISGAVYLDNIRLLAGPDDLPAIIGERLEALRKAESPEAQTRIRKDLAALQAADAAARDSLAPTLAITNLSEECGDPPARLYEPREVQFNLTREFDNPFDPEQVEVWALVRNDAMPGAAAGLPPGAAGLPPEQRPGLLVPGFYMQPAERFQQFGADAYRIQGPGVWAFRFTPPRNGPWSYALIVVDRRRLAAKLAVSLRERLGSDATAVALLDPDLAGQRGQLSGKIARELESRLRAEASSQPPPGGAGGSFLDRLAGLARADLGVGSGSPRDRQIERCAAALATPELAWLKELLDQGIPQEAATGNSGAASTPEKPAKVSPHFAARLLADTLLVTGFRPLCDVQPAEPGNHGFVRVSRIDARYFEFSDGSLFYPIGHNLRSPTDPRGAMILDLPETRDRGLNTYREFFQKMRANGENFCEIWMSSWFLDIEWTRRWPGYFGLNRYNQLHAARLDALLDLAQQYGIKLHFVLENHGKFSDWCDPEWAYSPYHEELQGGKLGPMDFFRDDQARAIYRKKLRYVVARYAHHPAIAGIELVSEFDLTGTSGNPNNPHGDRNASHQGAQVDWVRAMFEELRRIDPYGHPLTNHYATGIAFIDWRSARDLFDYVVGDVYADKNKNVSFLNHAVVFALKHRDAMDGKLKPFLITEYGGDWSGASPSQLAGDLKAGIWSSWMTGAAGTPLLWWFDLIDKENLYTFYRPFALFIAGEDPRGLDLKARICTLVTDLGYNKGLYAPNSPAPGGENVEKLDYILRCDWSDKNGGDATRGYGWILDREQLSDLPFGAARAKEARSYTGIQLNAANFKPGDYAVEFWDTQAGKVIETRKVTVVEGEKDGVPGRTLAIRFPNFTLDTAFKIKTWAEPTAPAADAPAAQPRGVGDPSPASTGTPEISAPDRK